jgi:4-oxalocrotonate tautomerase
MPLVNVYMWSEVPREAKTRIIKGITRVFEELRMPLQAVVIVIHEVPKENWVVGDNKQARNPRK